MNRETDMIKHMTGPRKSLAAAAALALVFGAGGLAAAQDQAATGQNAATASSGDEDMFGTEQVTEAAPQAASPEKSFIKYDQVRVGGQITSSLGGTAVWMDPWNKGLGTVDYYYVTPAVQTDLTITAKPAEDFGVNLDLRMTYPFTTSTTALSSATLTSNVLSTTKASFSAPNIDVWAAYAKFSLDDSVFMSFGKQPLAWGVSKGFFQPADDIFTTVAVDYTNLSAQREGPIAFKAMIPVPRTMTNFYFYMGLPPTSTATAVSGFTGLPSASNTSVNFNFGDMRYAAKAEMNAGNTELALAGYYCYNDYPRGLFMATTGTGDFNFYGEAIVKYGSERYFLTQTGNPLDPFTTTQKKDQCFFTGTLGGYYMDSDNNVTIMAQVLYNGEGQTGISAQNVYNDYFFALANSQQLFDRIELDTWYAGLSFSKSKLFTDDLSVGAYALVNLSDLSGFVVPNVTWKFSDYMNMMLSATFTFGGPDTQFVLFGPDFQHYNYSIATHSLLSGNPGAALSLTFTLGTGAF